MRQRKTAKHEDKSCRKMGFWSLFCMAGPVTEAREGLTKVGGPEVWDHTISSAIFHFTQRIVFCPSSSLPSLPLLFFTSSFFSPSLLPSSLLSSPLSPSPCDPDPEQMIYYLKYNPLNLSCVFHSPMLQEISQKRQIFVVVVVKKNKSSSIKNPSFYFPFATLFTLLCLALKSYKPRLGSFIIHGVWCFEPFNFLQKMNGRTILSHRMGQGISIFLWKLGIWAFFFFWSSQMSVCTAVWAEPSRETESSVTLSELTGCETRQNQ